MTNAQISTARDTLVRAIEFRGPAWTPYLVDCVPDQLAGYSEPAQIEALKQGLRDLGVQQTGAGFRAQNLTVNVVPRETALPAPYRALEPDEWVDEWGVVWTCREFPRVVGHPLEADWSLLSAYTLPDPRATGRYDEARRRLAANPDRYRLGHVWFTLFERLWFLRGFNAMLSDPYLYPDEFNELADRIVAFSVASIEQQVALGVDGIFFSDDWGTQDRMLMRPDDWRKWYKPYYKRLFDAVHAGGAHVWMHLCGHVVPIIGDLIDLGINVLNPVQPQAMNVDKLAAQYGGHLCFYGGIDVQGTLPHGTPQDVDREVRHLFEIFGRYSGGYIGGTSHSIMPGTPAENILTLYTSLRDASAAG